MEDTTLLVVTRNGFGKRTELDEYKTQTRSGKGILTYRVTEKTGPVAGAMMVSEDDDLLLITSVGTIIRMHVNEISVLSRVTQGVTLMRTSEENRVASLTRLSAAIVNDMPEESEEDLVGTADEEAVDMPEDGTEVPDGADMPEDGTEMPGE
jgi:DNA gyrase subunit A